MQIKKHYYHLSNMEYEAPKQAMEFAENDSSREREDRRALLKKGSFLNVFIENKRYLKSRRC